MLPGWRGREAGYMSSSVPVVSTRRPRPQVVHQLLAQRRDPLAFLTPRESEVLQLMAEGVTNAGIARRLVVGVGAVEKNVTSIFLKLGLEASASDHRRVLAVLRYLRS
ncbi:DNA-binding NarL/FixJ family response regulator [Mycetocola sp. 2940]